MEIQITFAADTINVNITGVDERTTIVVDPVRDAAGAIVGVNVNAAETPAAA